MPRASRSLTVRIRCAVSLKALLVGSNPVSTCTSLADSADPWPCDHRIDRMCRADVSAGCVVSRGSASTRKCNVNMHMHMGVGQ